MNSSRMWQVGNELDTVLSVMDYWRGKRELVFIGILFLMWDARYNP